MIHPRVDELLDAHGGLGRQLAALEVGPRQRVAAGVDVRGEGRDGVGGGVDGGVDAVVLQQRLASFIGIHAAKVQHKGASDAERIDSAV